MKRALVSLAAFLLLAGLGTLALLVRADDTAPPSHASTTAAAKLHLEELIPGMDYATWYQQQTGFAPDAAHFGAYAITPMTDTLFIGHSTAWPAQMDGALLSSFDGITITAIYSPTEQGIIAMTAVTDTLYIPGTDPCCPTGGSRGMSTCTRRRPVIKYRNLPNVLHTWAMWFDEASRALYAVVGAHLGDNVTWTGAVYRSTDDCRSWSLVADRANGVGDYRTYDMVGLHNKLYIYWNDVYPAPCGLAESSDGGATWQRLAVPDTACRVRLAVFQDRLLAMSLDQESLIVPNYTTRKALSRWIARGCSDLSATRLQDCRQVRLQLPGARSLRLPLHCHGRRSSGSHARPCYLGDGSSHGSRPGHHRVLAGQKLDRRGGSRRRCSAVEDRSQSEALPAAYAALRILTHCLYPLYCTLNLPTE